LPPHRFTVSLDNIVPSKIILALSVPQTPHKRSPILPTDQLLTSYDPIPYDTFPPVTFRYLYHGPSTPQVFSHPRHNPLPPPPLYLITTSISHQYRSVFSSPVLIPPTSPFSILCSPFSPPRNFEVYNVRRLAFEEEEPSLLVSHWETHAEADLPWDP